MKLKKILLFVFGIFFLIIGLPLLFYNIFYLLTRETSILGAGFAIIFIIVGIIFSLIGASLFYLSKRK